MRRSSKPLPKDINQLAAAVVRIATEEESAATTETIKGYLSRIGRKGGLKGGKARAAKLSASRRKQIAKRAAKARWLVSQ